MRHALLFILLLWPLAGVAEKMDISTHATVISKLERALPSIGKNDSSYWPVQKRLADLYAERARLVSIAKNENKCSDCPAAESDRAKAIALYRRVFFESDIDAKEEVLLQLGHLYRMTDQISKAKQLYTTVINGRYAKYVKAHAHTGMGDLLYTENRFAPALRHYESATPLSRIENKGYLFYRRAWCEFNMGHLRRARTILIALLQNPEFLERHSTDGRQVDLSFHQDVARDLVMITAREPFGNREIEEIYSLSPQTAQLENLVYLATEASRLGQKREALATWDFYLSYEKRSAHQIMAYVRIAQVHLDLRSKDKAVQNLEYVVTQWKKTSCQEAQLCETIRDDFRKLVIGWNRLEKKNPTRYVTTAYGLFTELFPKDLEMTFYAAQAARERQQWQEAGRFYTQASIIAYERLGKDQNDTEVARLFEGSLLGAIEMAEITAGITKSNDGRLAAYEHYLKLNPQGPNSQKARYQRAHVLYEMRRTGEAAPLFRAVALEKGGDKDMRKKAADLALDSLVLLKRDRDLEIWAKEFASIFPGHKVEYLAIARRAILTSVASVINDSKSTSSDFDAAWKHLHEISLTGAPSNERITYYKNRMLLAEKRRDLNEVAQSAESLQREKGLSAEDQELALAKMVWVAELQLDFAKAYRLAARLTMKNIKAEERELRLGLLAELSGRNPESHFKAYLSRSKNLKLANEIRARLILRSRSPWTALEREMNTLRRTPEVLAPLFLRIYADSPNQARAKRILQIRGVSQHVAGLAVSRHLFYQDWDVMRRRLARHRLSGISERLMQNTIRDRLAMLTEVENVANQAIRSGDWTLQVVTLETLGAENKRLREELLALPAPARLNRDQAKEYKKLLAQQAETFLNKSRDIERKLDEFWDNSQVVNTYAKLLEESDTSTRRLVGSEIKRLKELAPYFKRRKLMSALEKVSERPSRTSIDEAIRAVRRDPFDRSRLKDLRSLNERSGDVSMVAYLDRRIGELEGSKL